jgi:hypothetical protein
MAEVVVATLNVSFDSTADTTTGNIKLEIDDREDGLNNGNTSFKPGDNAYYWLFKDSNVTLLEHIATAGGISSAGSDTKEIDENITFTNSDTGSLGYPPNGSVSMEWLGRSYEIKGTVVSSNTTKPEVTRSELAMANGKKVAGILRCRYSSTGTLHRLSGVPKDFKESMIIAIGSIG